MTILIEALKAELPEEARHFVDFPEVIFFDEVYEHLEILYGTAITEFEVDGVLEMWLEFKYRGHEFYINNRLGDYRFLVKDPECPDDILSSIADHFRKILEKDE